MSFASKKKIEPKNGRFVYRSTGKVARPLSYVLLGVFYLLIAAAVIALICIPIVALMRITPEEMVLPPFLRAETGGAGNTVFHVYFGDGVRMTVPSDRVTAEAVKSALYAGILQFCLGCVVLAPVCRFVSSLLRNLADGRYGDKKNPDMVCFSALTLLVGSPLISAASGYFTYILQKNFAGPGVLVKYVFRPDWVALIMGLLLLFAGFAYGCENARLPAPPTLPVENKAKKD